MTSNLDLDESAEVGGMPVPKSDLASGWFVRNAATLGIAAVATVVLVVSLTYDVGELHRPGPGLWPLLVAAVVLLLCLAVLLVPERGHTTAEKLSTAQWRTVALAVLPLLLFAPVLTLAGTPIAIASMAFYSLKVTHRCTVRYSLVWTALFTGAIYLVFVVALSVPLPQGLIFTGGM